MNNEMAQESKKYAQIMNSGLLKEKQYMNPANVGIYFESNTLTQ